MESSVLAVWRYSPDWYARRRSLAAQGKCSMHGEACTDGEVVASVLLADAGSEDIRWAVCRRGLAEHGWDMPHDFPPGYEPSR